MVLGLGSEGLLRVCLELILGGLGIFECRFWLWVGLGLVQDWLGLGPVYVLLKVGLG